MKKRWKVIILISLFSVVAGTLLASVAARGWCREFDVHSGQERWSTTVFGFAISRREPKDSEVSKWLGAPIGQREWIEVERSLPRGTTASWCYSGIPGHLRDLEPLVDPGQRRDYALLILRELENGGPICEVSSRCIGMIEQLGLLDNEQAPGSIGFERLEAAWLKAGPDSGGNR